MKTLVQLNLFDDDRPVYIEVSSITAMLDAEQGFTLIRTNCQGNFRVNQSTESIIEFLKPAVIDVPQPVKRAPSRSKNTVLSRKKKAPEPRFKRID